MLENQKSAPKNKELSIDDFEALKCANLLKYGCPEKDLWLTECTTTEDFRHLYGDDLYFDLELDKYKYVVYYHESGGVEQHRGFNDKAEFDKSCKWVAEYLKPTNQAENTSETQNSIDRDGKETNAKLLDSENQERTIDYYEKLRTETLLKCGFPADKLFCSACFTIEEFHSKELNKTKELPESLDLDNYKNVLFYHDFQDTCLAHGFDDEKGFDEACKQFTGHFRKEDEEWQEGISNLEYYKHIKDKTLLKHGFPKHGLSMTKVMVVLEAGEDGLDAPLSHLIYNDSGSLMGGEPFRNEVEFEEACRKTAGYYEEGQKSRIRTLERHIKEHADKIVNRKWTYKQQECEGTYTFEGQAYLTSGIQEELQKDEIGFIVANMRKRIYEKKLEVKSRVAEAVGIDYLQVFEADDGTKIFMIDQLNHEMKESGEFKPEYDYWTMMLSHEY